MSKLTYWERRQVEDMYRYMSGAEEKAEEITKLYLRASRYLTLKADDVFEKYQNKYGLSETEARRLLNMLQDKGSLDELLQKLKSCKDSKAKQELLKELEAPAYQARLEHFRQLQNELDMVMRDVYYQEKQISTSFYVDLANESYYRNIFNIQQRAGVVFSFAHISAEAIEQVINSNWSGKNYSERIWGNTEALAKSLKEELLLNLVTGRSNREAAKVIGNKFGQSAFAARRLIRTESSFASGEMNFRAYKACGIEKYRFLATLDLRTSLQCRELDGRIFLVSEQKVGVNCNPMHPFCRSTTTSVVNEELLKKWTRTARDPVTGKNINVPATMTYKEWYEKYVEGNKEAETEEKKIKNRYSDRKQHQEYRKILGKEIPEKLDDFQNMKYNESEKWKYMKLDYRRQNELREHPELKLPNAENATAADAKFTKYLFGGEHLEGLAKGEAFASRLGYSIDNWKKLQSALTDSAPKYPAEFKRNNGHGKDMYEQKVVLYGKKDKPANVVIGWAIEGDTAVMASAYIKEVD